jgi:hypothetical protein
LSLATARLLVPDPSGLGTHRQLGLPPCGFLAWTGLRCPSCGMTTAMAWMTRGRIDRALEANPAGAIAAPVGSVVIVWLLTCAASGRPRWGARTIDGPLIVLTLATVAVGLAAWTIRMILGRVVG